MKKLRKSSQVIVAGCSRVTDCIIVSNITLGECECQVFWLCCLKCLLIINKFSTCHMRLFFHFLSESSSMIVKPGLSCSFMFSEFERCDRIQDVYTVKLADELLCAQAGGTGEEAVTF